MAANNAIRIVIFHNKATSPSSGEIISVENNASALNVDFINISGDASFSAVVEGKISVQSEWDTIGTINLKTFEPTTSCSTFDTYQCDLTGWSYVQIKIESISGTIDVIGKVVG